MKKPSVYLCGAISYYIKTGDDKKATEWRDIALAELRKNGFGVFNPMNLSPDAWKMDGSGILEMNRYYLKQCDVLLVNLDDLDTSFGSIWEMSLAHEYGIPIYAFGDCNFYGEDHLNSLITARYNTEICCLMKIINFYSA